MSQREDQLLWLHDVIEHLMTCQKQLEWTQDVEATHLLLDTMQRDLRRCEQLCESLRPQVKERRGA